MAHAHTAHSPRRFRRFLPYKKECILRLKATAGKYQFKFMFHSMVKHRYIAPLRSSYIQIYRPKFLGQESGSRCKFEAGLKIKPLTPRECK